MKHRIEVLTKLVAAAALSFSLVAGSATAAEQGSKDEAVALVKKAVAFYKTNGAEKAYAEFSTAGGQFVDRDLYVVAYDETGKCLAHGQNAKLIGKDLMDVTDADGKAYVKERVELAKTKPNFWQDYKFANPVTKKISPKETYCEHEAGGPIICVGIYKS